jgi:DNA-binding transcriptional ArsR family regulator
MADDLKHVNLDARQIKVLAHPLRARLLSELRLNGAATATGLAGVLRTNTGATSYHLRQLADVGLVTEDTGSGRGRERWWRPAHDVSTWERDWFAGDPDALAAVDWLTSNYARQLAERVEDWNRRAADEPPQWRSAVEFSDWIMMLSADQLAAMTAELGEVIERWRRETAADPAPDARQVLLNLYPVPMPPAERS